MSEISVKGVKLERQIAKLIRQKLRVQVQRDKRSGAGDTNKSDASDWYNETRLHIEAKNQSTIKVKEWFRQAEAAASAGQVPTVVFHMDNETLCTLRFSDLLDFMAEIRQQQDTINNLSAPVARHLGGTGLSPAKHWDNPEFGTTPVNTWTCRNGHLLPENDRLCLTKGCMFGHYKPRKGKKV